MSATWADTAHSTKVVASSSRPSSALPCLGQIPQLLLASALRGVGKDFVRSTDHTATAVLTTAAGAANSSSSDPPCLEQVPPHGVSPGQDLLCSEDDMESGRETARHCKLCGLARPSKPNPLWGGRRLESGKWAARGGQCNSCRFVRQDMGLKIEDLRLPAN